MSLITDNLLNNVQEHALRVRFTGNGDGVRNEGFWGINVVNGRTYKVSLWVRSEAGYNGSLYFELQNENGDRLGRKAQLVSIDSEWKQITGGNHRHRR